MVEAPLLVPRDVEMTRARTVHPAADHCPHGRPWNVLRSREAAPASGFRSGDRPAAWARHVSGQRLVALYLQIGLYRSGMRDATPGRLPAAGHGRCRAALMRATGKATLSTAMCRIVLTGGNFMQRHDCANASKKVSINAGINSALARTPHLSISAEQLSVSALKQRTPAHPAQSARTIQSRATPAKPFGKNDPERLARRGTASNASEFTRKYARFGRLRRDTGWRRRYPARGESLQWR